MKEALIVIDVQNNYFDPTSDYYVNDSIDILAKINKLIGSFKKQEKKVIFIRHAHKVDGSDIDINSATVQDTGFVEGTDATLIHPELNYTKEDLVITKTRYDAFENTQLENILKLDQIDTLYLVGFMMGFCISSTARSAHSKDFKVIVIEDCVSGISLPSIGFGDQEAKKIKNVELTIIACGIGKVISSSSIINN